MDSLRRGVAAVNAGKTHCPRGHPLVEGNLEPSALHLRGVRNCATCHGEQARNSATRQREAINEARQLLDLTWDKYIYAFGWSRRRADQLIELIGEQHGETSRG